MKKIIETTLVNPTDLIELEPFGVTAGMDGVRPVMLFREKKGQAVLPVWLSPVDAGIALTQHNVQAFAMSPHDVSLKVMGEMGVRLTRCQFVDLKGHQQYVDLHFSGSRKIKTLKFRADHAISFCLQAKTQFFCSLDFIEKCRLLDEAQQARLTTLKLRASERGRGPRYLN